MATVLDNPIIIGVSIGAPSFLLGYLGYRRSRVQDRNVASGAAIEQIIAGLNVLIDSLQEDRTDLRKQVAVLEEKLRAAAAEVDRLKGP